MAERDQDAAGKMIAAMFVQLLNVLTEKGVIDRSDVEQMMRDATQTLHDTKAGEDAFAGMGEKFGKEFGGS